jgi:CheY-like chemotaxis protein
MQAARVSPSVILLDFEMPAGNGGAVYKRLRELAQTQKTPIVFVSGRRIDEISKNIPPDPAVRFLKKPITPKELSRTLSEILPPDVWSAPPP